MVQLKNIKITAITMLLFILNIHTADVYAKNAQYIILSHNIAKMQKLSVVANNAANFNTTGYEADNILMKEHPGSRAAGRTSFVVSDGSYLSEERGGLQTTGSPLDLAIIGDGYFKVSTPKGPRYTLNGKMSLSAGGVIINQNGYPLLTADGSVIQVSEEVVEISVADDGSVYADQEQIARIGVFAFNPYGLVKEEHTLYKATSPEIALEKYTIASGSLRLSNVNHMAIMTSLVQIQHSVEGGHRLMQDINTLEKTAISKLTGR
jgi:flagellar basal-body rod protein FlgF